MGGLPMKEVIKKQLINIKKSVRIDYIFL